MPSLTDYFRRITKLEGAALAAAEKVLANVTMEEFLEDPVVAAELVKTAIREAVREHMESAAAVGRSFATSIVAAASSTTPESAVQAGIEQMERAIDAAVDQFMLNVTRQIESQSAVGVTNPVTNPAHFDTMTKRMAEAPENAVQAASNTAVLDSIIKDREERWTWITVHDQRVCVDCEPRHGVTRPVGEWIEIGIPGSGATVCGDRCRCVLLPEGYVDESVDVGKPVRMSRADLLQFQP